MKNSNILKCHLLVDPQMFGFLEKSNSIEKTKQNFKIEVRKIKIKITL